MQHNNRIKQFDRKHFYTLLQVGKAELGFDDEFYYGIFLPTHGATLNAAGRYSATTMSNTQLFSAVEDMKAKGFKVKPKAKAGVKKTNRKLADDSQSKKIRALWLELHTAGEVRDASEQALCSYVKRMTKVEALRWLSTAQASKVIESLKSWLERLPK